MPGLMELLQGMSGGTPTGAPPGAGMDALAMLQQTPPPARETEALREASNILGVALSTVQLTSPKAAKLLADAASKIQQAAQLLSETGQGPLAPPPSLGMQSGGSPMAPAGMMGA